MSRLRPGNTAYLKQWRAQLLSTDVRGSNLKPSLSKQTERPGLDPCRNTDCQPECTRSYALRPTAADMARVLSCLQAEHRGWYSFHATLTFQHKSIKLHGRVRERTIPTERLPLVGEVIANFLRTEGATWSAWRIPTAVFSVSRQEPLLFYQVAPQLHSRDWVDRVPDPLLFFLVVSGIEPGPPDL
jgi:hypothetical protein